MKKLKMFLLTLLLMSFNAFPLPYNKLENYPGFQKLDINSYSEEPIILRRGEMIHIRMTFSSNTKITQATCRLYFELMGTILYYIEAPVEALNTDFPIDPGQEVYVVINFRVPVIFPLLQGINLKICIDDLLYTPIAGGYISCNIINP